MSLHAHLREEAARRYRRSLSLPADMLDGPAWAILCDIAMLSFNHHRTSVTSVIAGAGIPSTTGLRWVGRLIDEGLAARADDPDDQRRSWLDITPAGIEALEQVFGVRAERRAA